MAMHKFTFPGAQGQELAARLDKPDGELKAYALFAHCCTCGKDIRAASRIAKALNGHGIAVLRFDFTGLGMSEGEFENTNFSSNVQDLLSAADHMREELEAPKILIGHSLGGTAVLKATAEIDEVRAVATIGAPSDAAHVAGHFDKDMDDIETHGEAEIDLAGRNFKIKKQFVEDIRSQNMKEVIADLDTPLLVLHAPFDDVVGIDNASDIFVTAKHPKSFISLDNADHLLSREEDGEYAAAVIAAWASRYIGIASKEARTPTSTESEDAQVIVRSSGKGRYQQDVQAGIHHLKADEPEEHDGDNTGPDPYSYLQVALGSCISMTLRMYADLKDLPLEGAEVYLSHKKIHAQDCESCETEEGKLDQFDLDVKLIGDDLTDEHREKLLDIAHKCPVHRTIKNETTFSLKEKR